MKAYQAGIAEGKLDPNETQVLGISVDSFAANAKFAEENGLTFPLLSDFKREVSKLYGILNEEYQFAMRTTFVIDKNGIIQYIEEGNSAVDPSGAFAICTRLKQEPK
jgi:peroxiredoxin